uniref:Secreted protein n=1 Tax=Ascaris lumbricoides TaxID=6252 RepID=A0A0M3HU04_ASCLU
MKPDLRLQYSSVASTVPQSIRLFLISLSSGIGEDDYKSKVLSFCLRVTWFIYELKAGVAIRLIADQHLSRKVATGERITWALRFTAILHLNCSNRMQRRSLCSDFMAGYLKQNERSKLAEKWPLRSQLKPAYH